MTRELRIGAVFALVAAVGWIVLALRTPTNTYHFAPIVIALAMPVAQRSSPTKPESRRARASIGSIGAVAAALIGIGLAATGNLEGPSLWGADGALAEVLLFSIAGAIAGVILILRR